MKRYLAIGAVALIGLLTIAVGLAGADTYTTTFEPTAFSTTFTNGATQPAGSVNAQDGWHSAIPTDIPALPTGYDQSIVDNTYPGFPSAFGTQALRVSNAFSEVTGEFEYQTYSPSVLNPAGETQTNKVFDGTFQFFDPAYQPGLRVSVSPDNGHGGRMSYIDLKDTAAGIQATFYDTAPDGSFQAYDAGLYSHGAVHTVEFKIQFVPGESNDILRLIIDNKDIGDSLGVCFTTWEQYYRIQQPGNLPVATDSFEFRSTNTSGSGYGHCDLNGAVGSPDPDTGPTCTVPGLAGGGYLFDSVSTITRNTDPPAPTVCSAVGKILPTGTTCQQYRDGTAPPVLDQLQYTTKGSKINSVSPGVFFYYTKVSGTTGDTVNMTQENDATTAPSIPIQQGQVVLYNALTCKVLKWKTPPGLTVNTDGTATGVLPSTGDFIIGTKYSPSSLKGQPVPNPTTVKYTFDMELNGVKKDAATLNLVPKPVGP
jgi:hypothetical protein